MPGSANFVGEFFILNGVFKAKIVYRARRRRRRRAGRRLHAAPLPALDAQPARPEGAESRDMTLRDAARARPARRRDPRRSALYPQFVLRADAERPASCDQRRRRRAPATASRRGGADDRAAPRSRARHRLRRPVAAHRARRRGLRRAAGRAARGRARPQRWCPPLCALRRRSPPPSGCRSGGSDEPTSSSRARCASTTSRSRSFLSSTRPASSRSLLSLRDPGGRAGRPRRVLRAAARLGPRAWSCWPGRRTW